ncbi:hypothetical protein MW344_005015 [Vibrio parahaemolyticus]|nr:hypothetical protein [Vibrio parahaemolyticus]
MKEEKYILIEYYGFEDKPEVLFKKLYELCADKDYSFESYMYFWDEFLDLYKEGVIKIFFDEKYEGSNIAIKDKPDSDYATVFYAVQDSGCLMYSPSQDVDYEGMDFTSDCMVDAKIDYNKSSISSFFSNLKNEKLKFRKNEKLYYTDETISEY